MRRTRLVPFLLVLAVVGASCGGGGSVFETGSTASATQIEDLVDAAAWAAAEAIVADLGAEAALSAVGYALDRGYAAGQITAGGREGALQADGTITGMEPELPLSGFFSDLPEAGGSGGGNPAGFALGRRADDPDPAEPSPDEVTKNQWVAELQAEADLLFPGPDAPSSGASTTERAKILIGLIIELSDLGYSAEQIIVGIALGELRVAAIPTGQGPIGCWLLQDSARGGVIAPAQPVLAGALRSTGECRRAIDRLAPPDTGNNDTDTPAVGDADGIPNGIYTGSVHLDGAVASPVWEILDSGVELTVTDEGVDVAIDYTLRFAWRWQADYSADACLATVYMAYVGQGPVSNPLNLQMTPEAQILEAISGTLCDAGGEYETDAEPEVRAWLANEDLFDLMLSGSFDGGRFNGNIDEFWGVTACRPRCD